MKSIQKIATLIAALIGFILAAEQPENGAEKKQKVIEKMQEFVNEYGRENLPEFLVELFSSEAFLSPILELMVWTLKRLDFLK